MLYSAEVSAEPADPSRPAEVPADPGSAGVPPLWEIWLDSRGRYRARPAGGLPVPGLIAADPADLREQLREAALRALL